MSMLAPIFAKIDAELRSRNEFTYEAIEDVYAAMYAIGEDVPSVDDDEMHHAVSFLHQHYVSLGLAREGE